jgi:hypothetical protein
VIGKDALLEAFLPTADVELPSGKGTVKVRGLTRWEAVETQAGVDDDTEGAALLLERRALARGMVEPQLTEEEAEAWQRSGVAADVAKVAMTISQMSALDDNAGKGPTPRLRRTRG